MASTPGSKGIRKTYSFEEREILVHLINKYLNGHDDEKNLDGTSSAKRKTVWSDLTDEYNSLVGPENTRSTMQLRRCWENMKANKKNRDDKKIGDKVLNDNYQKPTASLPPNVVFQPKDSEPFSLEGLAPHILQTQDMKKEEVKTTAGDNNTGVPNSVTAEAVMGIDPEFTITKKVKRKITPSNDKPKKQKIQAYESKLRDFNILEAQLKLDTAAILKEEAKIKLEEAQFRREESRMRMICTSYKLQRLREYCEDLSDDEER